MTSILHTYAAYKSHLEHLESVILNPDNYTPSRSTDGVPVTTDSLLQAKEELKADMAKISTAIDTMYDPVSRRKIQRT